MHVIQTKLSPPPLRGDAVLRRQLLETLHTPQLRKLTLVSAPAGFGKTTLLAQWFRLLRDRGLHCAWLALDHDDGEPLRFLSYFVAACRSRWPAFGTSVLQRLETSSPEDIAELLPELVADLGASPAPRVLFIDDSHHAGQPMIAHFLELLCNLSPPSFHLVLAGRIRPNLPLAALRVRNQLHEITSSQLRFDRAESGDFLRSVHGIELTEDQMESLHEHSEGWIAGLQLASLSLREHARPDEFIASFSGNLRDVAEYLATDVLDKQPAEVRAFLLRTCILQRLCADVCAVLTGHAGARAMLEMLEDQNLFLLPLDGERQWYRYHQLFQEFLQGQLRRRHPGDVVGLYRRAAEWFSAAGFAAEAVDYALLSGDTPRAIELIVPQVQQEIMAGRMPRVNDWIQRIPADVLRTNPVLLKANATALYHMNRPREAVLLTDQLEQLEGATSPVVRLLRAGISICCDDVGAILGHLAPWPADMSQFDNGTMNNIRGYAEMELGRYEEARASLERARCHHLSAGCSFGVAYADCFLGLMDLARGNPEACHARFDRPGDREQSLETYVAPVRAVMRGLVLYEWNRPAEAVALLRPSVRLLEQVGHIKLLTLAYIALGKLSLQAGDRLLLNRYFDHCLELGTARGAHVQRLQALVETERIRVLIAGDYVNEAMDRAQAMQIDIDADAGAAPREWERVACLRLLTWCRLQIAGGLAARALPVLRQLQQVARAGRRNRRLLECTLVEATAQNSLGDREAARRALEEALRLAAPGRQIMVFLEEGAAVRETLRALPPPTEEGLRIFLDAVLAAVPVRASTRAGDGAAHPGLREEFSGRERDVLRHVAAGHSNGVIADQLQISENTVKWHLKNIFLKLGVKNRTAAVAAARHQGWIN